MSPRFDCEVLYALPGRQWRWRFTVEAGTPIRDLLMRVAAHVEALPPHERPPPLEWSAIETGVFGEVRGREHTLQPGDRLELYRPLAADPKQRRRARAAAGSAAAGAAGRRRAR